MVLGLAMLDREVAARINVGEFFFEQLRLIAGAIKWALKHHNTSDPLTVEDRLENKGCLVAAGGRSRILWCIDLIPKDDK